MSIQVTLNIFSGKANPSWVLTDDQERQLIADLSKIKDTTLNKPSGVLGRLGFRGFSLTRKADAPGGAMRLYVHEGVVDRGQQDENLLVGDRSLESWLLDTGNKTLAPDVRRHVEDTLKLPAVDATTYRTNRAVAAGCPGCVAADAPIYQPTLWNIPSVQPYNNCYNYANNNHTNTFAQPGRAHGAQTSTMACPNVNTAAKADGLIDSPSFAPALSAGQGWYVALVIWPGVDYHWYRQDKVGCWSHKPGQTAVRNVDNSGSQIVDPVACDRGPYTVFCGYMITKVGNVIN